MKRRDPEVRSSPRKRGPRATDCGPWVPACAGTSGVGRREFVLALAGAAVAASPFAARAQQPALPVIGFLSSRSPGESAAVVAAFRRGLGEAGFVEGRDLIIAFRWAEGRYDQLPTLAADLVGLKVALLFAAGGPPSAVAAKAATSTIPVVFSGSNDPVGLGLVVSLNRPGGNVTGMSTFTSVLAAKRLELLKELVPAAAVMAYLINPSNPSAEFERKESAPAASALGIQLHVLNASTQQELDTAFATLPKLGPVGSSSRLNLFSTVSVTGLCPYRRNIPCLRFTVFGTMSWPAA
jgi:putative tryptophan/tyrosine transport system substrate-binding protein